VATPLDEGKLGYRQGDILVALKNNGTRDTPEAVYSDSGKLHVIAYVWNTTTMAWEPSTGGATPGANVVVTNFPATQPVSNAAIEASLAAIEAQLTTSDTRVIDSVHQKVHEGRFFSGGYYNPAVADGGRIELLVQVGATYAPHVVVSGASGGDSVMEVFEAPTFSSAGTAVVVSNHNRSSIKTFAGTVTHTPTLLTDGTPLNGAMFVPGGEKAQSTGGSGSFTEEFVLALNTAYLFRVTNSAGAAKKQSIRLAAYQPTL